MRISFRLNNQVLDAERLNVLNKEIAFLAARGWKVEAVNYVSPTTLQYQMLLTVPDEERLKAFLDSYLRLAVAGWRLISLPAMGGLKL